MPTALVTGPTSGIGRAFAQQLAARGHDLVLVSRDRRRLEETADALRSTYAVEVEVLPADLVDREQLALVEARVADPDRPIDVLVNNAGFGFKGRFLSNSADSEEAMLAVLVTAVMRLSHAGLGAMAERGGGGVINVSSVAGFLPRGTYGAAKSYVNSFSQWAAAEYRPQGLQVTVLCPGFVRTEFHERMGVKQASVPSFLWLDADQLVATALSDFDKGRVFSIPGFQYKAIVAGARLVPNGVLRRLQSLGRG